jgi:hypothetical protein
MTGGGVSCGAFLSFLQPCLIHRIILELYAAQVQQHGTDTPPDVGAVLVSQLQKRVDTVGRLVRGAFETAFFDEFVGGAVDVEIGGHQ